MRVLNSTIQGRCAFAEVEVEVEAEAEENLGNLLDRVVKAVRHENQASCLTLHRSDITSFLDFSGTNRLALL